MGRTSTAAALACAILIAPATATEAAAQSPPADDQRPFVTVSFGAGPIVTGHHLVELPRLVSGWAGTSFLVKEPPPMMSLYGAGIGAAFGALLDAVR